ncbi:3-oxoacyl-[acyl-carrier-protein] synthase-3 [Methylobacterium brachiatum]|uniref:3-oxoacyl-[acyl-carrier-protein] synthase-3 n=1 Tax=Methylobacterium brachiatum TaxID=269660 RepID=A0AAJ1TR73_9HYPH|nr:ketoacyl-ACP synthase III [Methylobacterium brachiatum]MCB4804314.1 ketoacyl-ACP synthase III [Methylobacterium brachiatum]MDQ0545336.1 3-oxoacyl-[acyl-carrier-protein] synthase-3 [Methylobacterium brachiatum]
MLAAGGAAASTGGCPADLETSAAASGRVARTSRARIAGLVSCLPPRRIENSHFAARFGSKLDDVVKMTGVRTRYWVEGGVTTSDLCARAARELLDRLAWDRASVDALVFVSQTPDYRLPATACSLQARLGLRPGIVAFDVPLGCSGYPYGLWLAMMMIQTGAAQRVLLAVGDTSSVMNDPDDRSTVLLFGDAGAVTALEAHDDGDAVHILGTDGRGAENLIVPRGAFRSCSTHPKFSGYPADTLYMDGGEVFNFTLKAIPTLIRDTIAAAGQTIDGYDAFVLHQANAFMLKHLAKKAKIDPGRLPINIDRYGNTSSASIPLVLTTDLAAAVSERAMRLALVGFGVGYSWASTTLTVGPLACAETVTL